MMATTDSIAAIATPPGKGGVGIVRVSGPLAGDIARCITGILPDARQATFRKFFLDASKAPDGLVDFGLVLFFPGPHSFTGEDVVEFQGHGGQVVMDKLLQAVLAHGARLALPGEFSERAFLNNKLDLAQAEAIADLIDSATEAAARSALVSLSGAFSEEIHALVKSITEIRVFIEASMDFSDEEIDFLADETLLNNLQSSRGALDRIIHRANSGRLLREGANIVIAGKPNAGKSSLLNYLVGHEAAIVTDTAGTTRDVIREYINLDGIPVHLLDTAGLRHSEDSIEQEGVRRAAQAIEQADLVVFVVDSTETGPDTDIRELWLSLNLSAMPVRLCVAFNKIDCSGLAPGIINKHSVAISVRTLSGLDDLKTLIKTMLGFYKEDKNPILARRRHLDALMRAKHHLDTGIDNLRLSMAAELVAEDLKACQDALGEITGTVYPDDLLGKIFNSFCIGK